VGDFNGDGKLDVATGDYRGHTMTVLLGSGDGYFQAAGSYASGPNAFFTAVADLDGDSRLDVVVANTNEGGYANGDSISVFRGNGDGTFRPALILPADSHPYGIDVADLNQDGWLDLLASGSHAGRLSVWRGNGDGSFQPPTYIPVAPGDYDVFVADVDGNGTRDVLTTIVWDNTVGVLLNQAAPADPRLALTAPASITANTPFDVTVTALDSSNAVAAGFTGTVNFRSSDKLAGLPADYTFTAADNGVQTFTITLHTAGTQTVTASLNANLAIAGSINLQAKTATALGAFANIATIVGSALTDTLTGANANQTWSLSGANAGSVGGVSFSSFEALVGGTANDTFHFAVGASVAGTISGGGGIDKLDYSAWSAAATVNLTTGTATATGGTSGIRNVTGGAGDDTFIGDAAGNALLGGNGDDVIFGAAGADDLQGGPGRDLIFAGSGADTVDGGAGEDVLLAGLLTYFDEATGAVDSQALAAIRAEWTRTDLKYAARIANLTNGGGLNGTYVLNNTTVLDDGAADTLFGRAALDWFLVSLNDAIKDLNLGGTEKVTTV